MSFWCVLAIGLIAALNIHSCTGCGFTRTLASLSTTVTITSPNYPSNYISRANCRWQISVPTGQTTHNHLNIRFTAFNTERNYDKAFVEGVEYTGTYTTLPNITSLGRTVEIRFTSDSSVVRTGFSCIIRAINTTLPCGGSQIIQSNAGSLMVEYPRTPAPTEQPRRCRWIVTTADSRSLELRILAFTLKTSSYSCYGSYLYYTLGTSTSRSTLCRQSVGWRSHSTRFRIDFEIRNGYTTLGTRGFRLQFTACGFERNITSNLAITTPNYPSNYPSNANCRWTIHLPRTSPYRYLQVRINYMNTQTNADKLYVAQFNYLSGSVSARTLYPPGRSVVIRFTSNAYTNYRGVSLTVQRTNSLPPCGGEILIPSNTSESGLTYPPASNQNPSPDECIWMVQSALNVSFDLVIESFTMKVYSHSCSGSYLYVGSTLSHSTQTLQLCSASYSVGSKVTSSNSAIRLRRNDRYLDGRGFRFRINVCGFARTLNETTSNITIESLRYPTNYPHGINCLWRVSAPETSTTHRWLKLVFNYFATQATNDPLIIEDYPPESGTLAITPANPVVRYSINSTLQATFSSNANTNARGFQLTVFAITMETLCGNSSRSLESVSDSIRIQSPRYPYKYASDSNCTWNVSVPESQTTHRWLRVSADSLDLRDDFLQIDNFTTVTGNVTSQRVWHSSRSFVIIRFRANAISHGQGFNLTVTATNVPPVVCDEEIEISDNQPEGAVHWPLTPPTNSTVVDCTWEIAAAKNRSVDLELEEISLKSSTDSIVCNGTWVRVHSRRLVNSSTDSHQLCTNGSYPVGWHAFGQRHSVNFESPVPSLGERGFRIKYKACGYSRILTNESVTLVLTSPRYPNHYPTNTRCLWNITAVHPVYRLLIMGHNVSMDSSNDFLEIENATSISNVTSVFSSEYTVSKLIIRFWSDGINASSGFNISVGARYKRCDEHGCSHNCSIVNHVPVCACPNNHGWTMGADNKTCSDVNECAPTHRNVCHGFVQCINTIGGFVCNCTDGYYLSANGRNCTDRNGGWNSWSAWSECSYECDGGSRYATRNCTQPTTEGNGQQCLKMDNGRAIFERRTGFCNPQACPTCSEVGCTQICRYVRRVPRCSCRPGWRLHSDNSTCVDLNECAAGQPTVCHGHAACINTVGSYRCNCTDRYKLSSDGRSCMDRDGGWDKWADWSPCSASCQRSATRNCSAPTPARQGLVCMRQDDTTRSMNETRTEKCTGGSCPSSSGGGGGAAGAAVGVLLLLGGLGAAGGVLYKLKFKKVAPAEN